MPQNYRLNIPRFATWFLGLSIGLPLLIEGLKAATGLDLSSGGLSVIPIMLTTMNEGAHYVRATKTRPDGQTAWKLSALFALFGTMLSMLLAAIVLVSAPQVLGWAVRPGVAFILIFAAVMFTVFAVVARIFVGLGARNEMRRLEAAEARAGDDSA